MTGNDPADVGATHDTDADASPATARADVGAPGGYTSGFGGLGGVGGLGGPHGHGGAGGLGGTGTAYDVLALPPTASTVIAWQPADSPPGRVSEIVVESSRV